MRYILLSFLFAGTALCAAAKTNKISDAPFYKDTTASKTDTAKNVKKASLELRAGFANNTVFLGRTDSVAISSYNLGLTYTLKCGLFFSGSVNYIPSRQFDKVDGGGLEAGYNFDANNLSGGIALSKYFASFNSTELVSALDATVRGELSYDLYEVVTPSVEAEYALGRSGGGNDFLLNTGLTHEFGFDKVFAAHDHLGISPAFHMNSGTQNFYTTYITRKNASAGKRALHGSASVKGNGKGVTVGTSTTTTTTGKGSTTTQTTSSNKFQVLDYEWSMPITYGVKKFTFEFSPIYAIAVHKIYDDGTSTTSLPNSSVFYFQAAVSYKF